MLLNGKENKVDKMKSLLVMSENCVLIFRKAAYPLHSFFKKGIQT